jgi:hypothetical protein
MSRDVESMVAGNERIVAVGLLSERELKLVGQTLQRLYHIDEGGDAFDELIAAIDAADRKYGTETSEGR